MYVKICGITTLSDALFAISKGVNALGFVFHKDSARYISPDNCKKIIDNLPPFVQSVALFTEHTSNEINEIMSYCKLNIAQVHKKVDGDFLNKIDFPTLSVLRIKEKSDLLKLDRNKYYLVDAYVRNYGGEGVRVDLSLFDDIDCSKLILAGGLNASCLHEVKKYNFFGVDVSSGVESSKGIKDKQKIKEFLLLARQG